jgi:hypothetical protein
MTIIEVHIHTYICVWVHIYIYGNSTMKLTKTNEKDGKEGKVVKRVI